MELTVTITAPSMALTSTAASVNAVSSASLASSLGRAVLNLSSVQEVAPQAASCAEGYGGPYCAVCATGYFGGGEGGTCSACADAGDPNVTIAIQGGASEAFACDQQLRLDAWISLTRYPRVRRLRTGRGASLCFTLQAIRTFYRTRRKWPLVKKKSARAKASTQKTPRG